MDRCNDITIIVSSNIVKMKEMLIKRSARGDAECLRCLDYIRSA